MQRVAPAVLFLTLLACGTEPSKPTPTSTSRSGTVSRIALDALLGEWQDVQDDERTVFHERWSRSKAGGYSGLGFVLSGADTVFIEHLAMHLENDTVRYAATIRSQNEGATVIFKLVNDLDSLVFTNHDHDFPQRIVYVPHGEDGWNVTISGRSKGVLTTDHLRFTRRPPKDQSHL